MPIDPVLNEPRRVAVIDIGKTNAKVALVDLETASEVTVRKTPNNVRAGPPYPHFDCDRLFGFVLDSLAEINSVLPIDAISVTAHGATAALVTEAGALALPVLDYEYEGPDSMRAAYEKLRPDFAESGSPPLPVGLNLGAQIHWQAKMFPEQFSKTKWILMYPQYWSFRLTGVAASEVTSLGCHTDLWNPWQKRFSSLVKNSKQVIGTDWLALFPPVLSAGARLGSLKPELSKRIGLRADAPVLCGIHDSNASLLAHLANRQAKFSVVSTGTWVISMSIGGAEVALDPARDTLVNVNALGEPTPTARFMGGREFELVTEGENSGATDEELAAVLGDPVMLLPSLQAGSGPYPSMQSTWRGRAPRTAGERFSAASFYCALMTATCLELIGAEGPVFVEGPFAGNELYCGMLNAVLGRAVIAGQHAQTGTAVGAAMLASSAWKAPPEPAGPVPHRLAQAMKEFARKWRTEVEVAGGRSG